MSERRRGSLLDSIKSPLINSNDLSIFPHTSDSNSAINSINNDPFELNSSIWSNNNPNNNNNNPQTAQNSLPTRRASDLYPQQQQQNYTIWSTMNNAGNLFNGSAPIENWAGNNNNTANTVYSPRRFSLDSYASTLPVNYELAQQPLQQQVQPQPSQQQQQQQVPQQPQHHGSSASGASNTFNESYYESLSPPQSQSQLVINESTPQLIQTYQQLDFYFVQDPHKRISISVDSLNGNNFESLITGSESGQPITLPKFQNTNTLPSQQLVLVSFKCGRIDVFYLPENSALTLKTGDLVIVEADRGKDLGKVVRLDVTIDEARLLKYLQFMEQQAALNSFSGPSSHGHASTSPPGSEASNAANNNVPTLHFPKPILRLAYPQEVLQLLTKLSDEEKAKKICLFKIESIPSNSGALSEISGNMQIIDAEYQFDRRKLTFYYAANHRIDFRDLVRDLFRVYKTRIWMCAVNTSNQPQSSNGPTTQVHDTNANENQFGGFEFNQNIWASSNQIKPLTNSSNNITPTSPRQQGHSLAQYNQYPPSSPNNYGFNDNSQFPQQNPQSYGLNTNNRNTGNGLNGFNGFNAGFNEGFDTTGSNQPGYFGMNTAGSQNRFVSNSIWN